MSIERLADRIVLGRLLDERVRATGSGPFDGEVTGLIAAGAFVRFDGVFDGFLPARTIDPEERYLLDEHGLALVGSRSGDRLPLGSPVEVVVVRVERHTGKVDLRLVRDVRDTAARRARAARATRRGGAGAGGDAGSTHGAGGRRRLGNRGSRRGRRR